MSNSQREEMKDFLSLKIMRKKKPDLKTSLPILCEKDDSIGSLETAYKLFYPNKKYDGLGFSEFMSLPEDFGKISVGEDLKLYINITNISNVPISNIVLKVELAIGRDRQMLRDMSDKPISSLLPKRCYETTLEHSLCENGMYIIVCNVSYKVKGKTQKNVLRKIYKFNADLPLEMKDLEIHEFNEKIYFVSIELKNISKTFLNVGVDFIPSKNVVKFTPCFGDFNEKEDVFYHSMGKKETRGFLFKVEIKNIMKKELGKIEFSWRKAFGEKGALITSKIQKILKPVQLIDVIFSKIPKVIETECVFEAVLKIQNNSSKDIILSLICDTEKMFPITLDGKSVQFIGTVKSKTTTHYPLSLLPLKAGVQVIGDGIQIHDVTNSVKYSLGIKKIYVYPLILDQEEKKKNKRNSSRKSMIFKK